MNKLRKYCLLSLTILLAMPAGRAAADVFMKHRIHIHSFKLMRRVVPEQVVIQKTWVGRNRMRSDNAAQSVLLLLDRKVLYFIDHEKKTYASVRIDMDRIVKETALFQYPGAGRKNKKTGSEKEMLKSITVKKTGDLKVIRGWKCVKYIVTAETGMGKMMSEIWSTGDISFRYGRYALYSSALTAVMPGVSFSIEDAVREIRKIRNMAPSVRKNMARAGSAAREVRGVPVYIDARTRFMDSEMRTSRELLEFRQGNAPAGIYQVPSGYMRKTIEDK